MKSSFKQFLQILKETKIVETNDNIEVQTWFERDRAHVGVTKNGRDIVDWWDDEVKELVEDGFLNPKDWEGSAIEYCRYLGLLENTISMKDHISKKIKETDKEIEELLNQANAAVDKGFVSRSKRITKDAWQKHLENKKLKNAKHQK